MQDQDLVEFIVMAKDARGDFKGLGSHHFRLAPRMGEFVTLNDDNGIGQAYEVTAVIHPLDPASAAGDLILKHIGTDVEMRMGL
jgi:hypothetical protein